MDVTCMINDIMELFQSCSNFNAYNFVLKSTFQRDLKNILKIQQTFLSL